MGLLGRYVMRRLGVMTVYALIALLALYSFFDLLNEVGNIGKGGYTLATAFTFVLMQMPAHAYQLMPLAVLVGALVGLSRMSADSELAVIKTSGLSNRALIGMILRFSLIFALLTVLLGEWAAPQLSRRADALKAAAKNGQISAAHDGLWLRQPGSMVNIAAMLPDHTLVGVKIWRYDENFKLQEAVAAEKALVGQKGWHLQNVRSSLLEQERVRTRQQTERIWPSAVNTQLLDVLVVKPEQMSFRALTGYIRYLRDNRQYTLQYDVAWWNKLVYPLAVMVMSLVALAFTPVGSRHSNMGLRLFGGICLGLLFFFAGRLFGFTSQLYGVPAFISAVLPTAAFALWAGWLIRRQERR